MTGAGPRSEGDPGRIRQFLTRRQVWFYATLLVSVAVLYGGSQIAHDRGQSADWYTGFGQWLGALGSFVAAGVALWIAVASRRQAIDDQRRSADTSAEAEAGLVFVRVADPVKGRFFECRVANYGARPILNLAYDCATYAPFPHANAVLQEVEEGLRDVLPRDGGLTKFWVDFVDAADKSVLGEVFDTAYGQWTGAYKPDPKQVIAAVTFQDVHGTTWRKDSKGKLRRVRPKTL